MTGTPPRTGGRTGAGKPAVCIQLLTLGRFHVRPTELLQIYIHRHMLALYVVVIFLLIGLDTSHAAGELTMEVRGGIIVLSLFTFFFVISLFSITVDALRPWIGTVTLHMSPMLVISTLCSVAVGELLVRSMMVSLNDSASRLILLWAFHYVFSELAVAVFAHTLLPVLLGEVRGLPIRKLAETDPALWTDAASGAVDVTPPPLAAAPDGFLTAAGLSFPFRSLLHLQAEGNYVHIRTTDRHELLPGPLALLVAQLPETLGRQVHRSHWVARSALRDWTAEGREVTLWLANGKSVPVAVTRRHEVKDWLLALGLPRRDAP